MATNEQKGQLWRRERIGRGLGLREAARRAGISPGFLSDFEHGRRVARRNVQARIAVALADDTRDLLAFAVGDPDVISILRLSGMARCAGDGNASWAMFFALQSAGGRGSWRTLSEW
jgi:transcriptional regulator with XRE-family HTH domain